MSFSPRNVSQLLVGSGTADQLTNVGDYIITPIADPATASGLPANLGARIQVKTTKGTKVSDFIPRDASYVAATAAAGVAGQVTLTYPAIGTAETHVATIVLHDHIGSVLNERFVSAYVVIDADGNYIDAAGSKVTATATNVAGQLEAQLQASLDRASEGFTVSSGAGTVTVLGAIPDQRVGAKDGIANPFEVKGGVKDNISGVDGAFFNEAATKAIDAVAKPGDLTQLINVEWFNSGYDKDPYREIGSFASFEADSNLVAAGVSATTAYGIFQFYKDRDATNLERQHRQLIVVGGAAAEIKTALDATTI